MRARKTASVTRVEGVTRGNRVTGGGFAPGCPFVVCDRRCDASMCACPPCSCGACATRSRRAGGTAHTPTTSGALTDGQVWELLNAGATYGELRPAGVLSDHHQPEDR